MDLSLVWVQLSTVPTACCCYKTVCSCCLLMASDLNSPAQLLNSNFFKVIIRREAKMSLRSRRSNVVGSWRKFDIGKTMFPIWPVAVSSFSFSLPQSDGEVPYPLLLKSEAYTRGSKLKALFRSCFLPLLRNTSRLTTLFHFHRSNENIHTRISLVSPCSVSRTTLEAVLSLSLSGPKISSVPKDA